MAAHESAAAPVSYVLVMTAALQEAREAYRRHDWVGAHAGFRQAQAQHVLAPEDLSALADAAWWLGRTDETLAISTELYRQHLGADRRNQAARLAMEIGFLCYLRGDASVGSGWIGRARRLVRDDPDSVEHGYLMAMAVDQAMASGDFEGAIELARKVQSIADLFRDPTLGAMGLVAEGIALVKQGRVTEGMTVLDEAMLPVRAGEVEPGFAGNIYCQLMGVCHDLADLPRARQWTEATQRWCDSFPSAVMFVGICRVHRAQLMQIDGRWPEAEREAALVCTDLARLNVTAVAEGHYQVGEIRRLRGDAAGAEEAYRMAHEFGRSPQPGLALLWLAEGRPEAASAALRTALAEQTPGRLERARLCTAVVEACLAVDDLNAADAAAVELGEIAARFNSPGFAAAAAQASGMVQLARGRPDAALPALRRACRSWLELNAPYETARVRVLLAQAYRDLGDAEAATLELDAATSAFATLGAAVDIRRTDWLRGTSRLPAGLTAREVEVLARVAAGSSNRDIATALVISEKTVARHLSNIFGKLGVSSRTEAAAFAFTHGLNTR